MVSSKPAVATIFRIDKVLLWLGDNLHVTPLCLASGILTRTAPEYVTNKRAGYAVATGELTASVKYSRQESDTLELRSSVNTLLRVAPL